MATDEIRDALHTYRCCEAEMEREQVEIDRIKALLSEASVRYNRALISRMQCGGKLEKLGFTNWEEIGL